MFSSAQEMWFSRQAEFLNRQKEIICNRGNDHSSTHGNNTVKSNFIIIGTASVYLRQFSSISIRPHTQNYHNSLRVTRNSTERVT